ncbi:MAG: helix-turn-helix transcriptional regulator [Clostridia bacterium]|nr:helix-turn-helix transcriptional regulator [Clostridia bacterium]
MPLKNSTKTTRQRLNKLFIPDITEPYHIKVHWIRAVFPPDGLVTISNELHIHTFFELHLITDGEFHYRSENNRLYTISRGSGLLIPAEKSHMLEKYSETACKISVAFSPDKGSFLYKKLKESGIFSFAVSDYMLSILSFIINEGEINSISSPYLIRNRIFELICLIQRTMGMEEETGKPHNETEDRRITAAKLFIKSNSQRLLTCNEVASFCGLSTKQTERLFFASTGRHLSEYIKSTRLSEAERLLLETRMPIKEVSEALGFSNVYNFTNFFTKRAGISPGAYRKSDMRKEN